MRTVKQSLLMTCLLATTGTLLTLAPNASAAYVSGGGLNTVLCEGSDGHDRNTGSCWGVFYNGQHACIGIAYYDAQSGALTMCEGARV
jgi:hypothetical protein